MPRSLVAFFLCLLTVTGYAFEDPPLAVTASQYQQLIREAHPGGGDSAQALAKAERYASQKLWADAITQYETAIAAGEDQTPLWIRLSQAWRLREPLTSNVQDEEGEGEAINPRRSLQAAYNAYRAAKTPDQQARALFILGELYEQQNQPKMALKAYREGLGLEANPTVAKHYQQLLAANAFQLRGLDVEADSATPRLCLKFSEPLSTGRQVNYADYLTIQPAIKAVVSVQDTRLCVEGVSHGQSYTLTVRPGLPAAAGDKLEPGQTFTAKVEDREPSISFPGNAYVLPRIGGQNLPLTSVNLDKVRLRLLRINDRNLTAQLNERRLSIALDGYDIKTIADQSGEQLWQGTLAIQGERNQDTVTAVPMTEILKNSQPGLYILTAEPATGEETETYENRATQWLVVSDLGLSTFQGSDGLHVFVHSLDSARPLKGVDLRLYARNNSELGQAVTDGEGEAHFAPGLLRGSGGREPLVLMAYSEQGDFNFLDLTRPAFDLSDRGVTGREAPGPVDAFLYSERGVYRPGETVELMALLRDNRAYALDPLPLTLKLIRPDEVEAERLTVSTAVLGGYHARLPLAGNARTGAWTVRAYTDPNAAPVGQLRFQVEDFVPQRIKLSLETAAKRLEPGVAVPVNVAGRFYYGAPAANLKTQAELVLREDPDPYPAYPGYRFGLVQDSWNAKRFPVDLVATDEQGKAQANVKLDEVPDTSRPLKAVLQVSLFDPGGRPVNRSLALPYSLRPFAIGIRPQFGDEGVPLGQPAAFNLVALDGAGQPQAVRGLRAELYREDYRYYWYYQGNRWDYKLIIRDSALIAGRGLELLADQPNVFSQPGLEWGNYRLEVFDPASGAATSVRFEVGWFARASEADTPDQLKLSLDKPRYLSGETAKVHIRAPFAGEVLLTVASDKLWTRRHVSLTSEETVVELPVSADWSPGVYVTATAFRPARNPAQRGPGRAIGVAWLALDPQARTLTVQLDPPKELLPRQSLALPVKVAGLAPGQPAWLTLAAVDEGILQLTDYQSPNPAEYFLGKRKLGMDLRDLYGRLIETGGRPGQLRSGGDEGRQLESTGVRTYQTVALFSGPVAVDDQGQAQIPLNLPDFNGQLRLMAVAWDQSRLGQGEAPLLVRDPLVVLGYPPRFLAPDDVSRFALSVQNLSAPPGEYRLQLTSEGAVALEGETAFSFPIADNAVPTTQRQVYPLRGLAPGVGRVTLNVTGSGGFNLVRTWELPVRAAQPVISDRRALRLEAGQGVRVDQNLLQDYVATTGRLSLSFASRPNLDVPGLLSQLERYPYGCVEQTTSTAFPLLYFNEVAAGWAATGAKQERGLNNEIQQAIQRILSMQLSDGMFGLWHSNSAAELWLTAYVLDFLSRAKAEGYLVPEVPYQRALEQLQKSLLENEFGSVQLVSRAYALYVLARVEQAAIGDLRYLHDNYLQQLPTRLARAQLAAALARYGERNRALEAFRAALENPLAPPTGLRDYGSPLRDQAALVALLAESGLLPEKVPQLAEEVAVVLNERRYTSTQEQMWLLLAARALLTPQPGQLRLSVNGKEIDKEPYFLQPTAAQLTPGLNIANRGTQPAWYVVNRSGVPVQLLPPAQQGFTITRRFYTRAGQEVDPTKIRQNDLLVAVISGEATGSESHQALIVDLLAAGLEIENTRLAHASSLADLAWLPKLSATLNEEYRDDRYVAALDLDSGQRQFNVAYLVRAITPGDYRLPAVFVEDMYKPWLFGRAKMGMVKVE